MGIGIHPCVPAQRLSNAFVGASQFMEIGFCTSGSLAKTLTLNPSGTFIFAAASAAGIGEDLSGSLLYGVGKGEGWVRVGDGAGAATGGGASAPQRYDPVSRTRQARTATGRKRKTGESIAAARERNKSERKRPAPMVFCGNLASQRGMPTPWDRRRPGRPSHPKGPPHRNPPDTPNPNFPHLPHCRTLPAEVL